MIKTTRDRTNIPKTIILVALCLAGKPAMAETAAAPVQPAEEPRSITAMLKALPDRTGLILPKASMKGEHLDEWRNSFYRRGPQNRNYCVKMAYNPDRQTAFFCGGNHGVPHKLADAWEYRLASNTWIMLAPPEGGNLRSVFSLYGRVKEGKEAKALELVRKHIILEDGVLVTRQTGGPWNTLHTWDGLTYDPKVKRALWAAPGTGIGNLPELYAKANGLDVDEVKKQLAPGIWNFWTFDFAANRWKRHVGPKPYPDIRFTITMTYIPCWGKTLFYGQYNKQTWTYDAVANVWEKLKTTGNGPNIEMMSAYSPKHRKLVSVQGQNTWTFDIDTLAWSKVGADEKNAAHDARCYFGYDPHNDVFLLYQHKREDRVRVYDLEKNTWETAAIKGDMPQGKMDIQGYYDPDQNVMVTIEGLTVWVYRYANRPGD